MSVNRIVMLGFVTLISLSGAAWGRGESHPRALGMGGAYIALARDVEAPDWNPANLGLSRSSGTRLNLFNTGLRIRNNAFSLADYKKYNGQYLDDADKDDILTSIPAQGLGADASAEISALNFTIGNLAITYKGYGSSSVYIDRDPLKLLFLGNAVMRDVSLTSTRGEGYAFADFAASYGYEIRRWQGGEMAIGASLHYLQGLAYSKVIETSGGVVTTDTGYVGEGYVKVHSSHGGRGFSSDLGLAVRFRDNWYFSATWQNVLNKVFWTRGNEESVYSFFMEPLTIERLSSGIDINSLVTTGETSYSVGPFSSRLAPVIRLGIARSYPGLTWSVDWEQSLFDGPCQGVNPRLAAGIEYLAWRFMPIRSGLAFGGSQGSLFSIGFGLRFGMYEFDAAAANAGSPSPWHTRGIRLAAGMGLRF